MEEWKIIPDTEGVYSISKEAVMRNNLTGKTFKGHLKKSTGYIETCLRTPNSKRTRTVHRIMGETWLGAISGDGLHVNHIDEDKTNNLLSNLELVTPKDNSNHGIRNSKVRLAKGYRIQTVELATGELRSFDNCSQASMWYGKECHYFQEVINRFNGKGYKFTARKMEEDEKMTIYVNAPIGSGKTSLSNYIGELFDIEVYSEKVDGNELLELFYTDRKRYSFLFQIHVMNQRFKDIKKARLVAQSVADSDLYSDSNFVKLMLSRGEIHPIEAEEYFKLHNNMLEELEYIPTKVPELMIFINIPFETELERISKRGRDFEDFKKDPSLLEYFEQHHKIATDFQNEYDKSEKLIIDGSKFDFVGNEEDRIEVLSLIIDKLFSIGSLTMHQAVLAYHKLRGGDIKKCAHTFYNHANMNGFEVPYHVVAHYYDLERK